MKSPTREIQPKTWLSPKLVRACIVLLPLISGTALAAGEPGNSSQPEKSACREVTGRFVDIPGADGAIVKDTETGLEWQRCPVGMRWSDCTCVGSASQLTWQQAVSQTAPGGFRLPSIDELNTMKSHNNAVFFFVGYPSPNDGWFWSSTSAADHDALAWHVWFDHGISTSRKGNKSNTGKMRLVR
jgi:hypothetical protein